MATIELECVTVGFDLSDPFAPGPYPGTYVFNSISADEPLESVWVDGNFETWLSFTGTTTGGKSAGLQPVVDPGIPSTATINTVVFTNYPDPTKTFTDAITVSSPNTLNIFTKTVSTGMVRDQGVLISPPFSDPLIDYEIPFTVPGNSAGDRWTPENVWRDIIGWFTLLGAHSTSMLVGEARIRVTFTMLQPFVSTSAPLSVGATTATVGGLVNPFGATDEFPVNCGFRYGVDPTLATFSTSALTPITGSGLQEFEIDITGLAPNTTYYYVATASNGDDFIVADNILSFTTVGANSILGVY